MHTQIGAHAPVSPSLVGQAHEVSNIDIVPESADLSWSDQGFKQRDELAVRFCNPNSVEAGTYSCPSAGEGKEVLSSENLEPSSGSHDPLA
jgi:hypothetical protein